MTTLEEEIKQIIDDVTDREYIGKLQVTHEDDIWTLYLFLDMEITPPIVMSIQGDEETFKKFIKREMRKRRLQCVKFWKTIRELPALECVDNGELELGW